MATERLEIELLAKDLATAVLKRFGRTAKTEGKKAETQFRKTAAAANRMKGSLRGMVLQFASFAIAIQSVRKGTRDFLKFSEAMGEVSTILDETQFSLAAVDKNLLDLALSLGENETLIAKGFYQTLSAGVTDAADAMFVLNASAKLGIAGLASTEAAVDIVTTVINAYGLSIQSATDITDTLFKTVELGKTRIPELASSMGSIIPVAAELGVDLVQVAGAIAAMTKQGASTSEAVTRLASIFTVLQKKSAEVAEIFEEKLGKTFDRNTLRAQGLTETLLDLRRAFDGNEDALVKLIGRKEGITGLFSLTSDGASVLIETLEKLEQRTGATEKAFQKQLINPAREFLILTGGIRQGLEAIGKELISTFIGGAKEFGTIQEAAETLRDTIAAFGPGMKTALGLLGTMGLSAQVIAAAMLNVQFALGQLSVIDFTNQMRDLNEALIISAEITRNLLTGGKDFTASQIIQQKKRRRLIVEEHADIRSQIDALEFLIQKRIEASDARTPENPQGLQKGEGIEDLERLYKEITERADAANTSLARLLSGNTERARELRAVLESLGVRTTEISELPDINIVPPDEPEKLKETISLLTIFKDRLGEIAEELSNEKLAVAAADGIFFALDRGFDRLANDIVEGKASFADFADQVVKDIARVILKLLLLRAVRAFLPGLAEGGTTGPLEGTEELARGGVRGRMVGRLPMRSYAHGGIASSPQLAIFGEGTSPGGEAFVPLGGDRKIPVKFPDGGPGGGVTTISLTVNSIDPRGAADAILAQETLISNMIANALATGRSRRLVTAVRGASGR